MNCFKSKKSSNSLSPSKTSSPAAVNSSMQSNPQLKNVIHQVLLRIPGCKVYLMDEGEALELSDGDLTLFRISDGNVSIATTIKVGNDIQWPLTKDEPVVKLDALHYLFSLPMKNTSPLSYGVTFSEQSDGNLKLLDTFLIEHSCFSTSKLSATQNKHVDWKEFAPRINDYNSVLAKAIAGGTGHIVRGIFTLSNAYTNQVILLFFFLKYVCLSQYDFDDAFLVNVIYIFGWTDEQVQKGGETIRTRTVEGTNGRSITDSKGNKSNAATKKSNVNKSIKRYSITIISAADCINQSYHFIVGFFFFFDNYYVCSARKLSKMTEKMSKALLDGVGLATGSVMGPVMRSQAGKGFFNMVPGEVLLASLDAVSKLSNTVKFMQLGVFFTILRFRRPGKLTW